MILAWQKWDPSPQAQRLDADSYVKMITKTFGSDLAVVSFLRNQVNAHQGRVQFSQLLYAALYGDPTGSPCTPDPNHVHQHIVQLFREMPGKVWTTNYDDLLEEAARLSGIAVRTLDLARRKEDRSFSIAHIHGFLAPPDRANGHPTPQKSPVILAEDDYHGVAVDLSGWTNREYQRLFDGRRVLILGMSLTDPNLRRVLLAARGHQGDLRRSARHAHQPEHFAVLRSITPDSLELSDPVAAEHANKARIDYWRSHNVEVVSIPDRPSIGPLLMRVRYESYGSRPGDLWREGAKYCERIDPWQRNRQHVASVVLTDAVTTLRSDFGVSDPSEIVEIGMFLLKADARTIELVFRGGATIRAARGTREFSVDPDHPTGMAGRVFVSGDIVRVPRDHPLYDYGIAPNDRKQSVTDYEGIISVPLIDWQAEGVPIGVIYVTVSTTTGTLFHLPFRTTLGASNHSLFGLGVWLQRLGLDLLSSMA